MKFVKKLTALFLAIVMTMAMGVTAFAEETKDPKAANYTITINEQRADFEYEAYQVFSGTLKEEKQADGTTKKYLGDIKWGASVNGDAILSALKNESTFGEGDTNLFKDCESAADVAEVVATFSADTLTTTGDKTVRNADEKLVKFADIVGQNLKNKMGTSVYSAAGKNYTISGLEAGYYLIKNTAVANPAEGEAPNSFSRFMLEVVSNTSATPKTEVSEIDKNIIEKDAEGNDVKTKNNTATIGTKVNYQVDSTIPNMDGYTTYYYILHDTLSKGLTFDEDVQIVFAAGTANEKTLTQVTDENPDGDYIVRTSTKDDAGNNIEGTHVEIIIKDFIQYASREGQAIKVAYSATLNENAVLTDEANTNVISLEYSNNPNLKPSGGKDVPSEDDREDGVTGETPKQKTKTYATGLELTKVDSKDENVKLAGATFTIKGTSKKTVITNKEMFIRNDAKGEYYLLKDGTYTTKEPTQDKDETDPTTNKITHVKGTADLYYYDEVAKTYPKYEKVTTVTKDTTDVEVNTFATTNANGYLTITGLGEGTYTITEIKAPDGYNLLKEPIVIDVKAAENKDKANWTITKRVDVTKYDADKDQKLSDTNTNTLYELTVQNSKGSVLPSTGGMGTTVIYIAGIAMIIAAGVVIIARKRVA